MSSWIEVFKSKLLPRDISPSREYFGNRCCFFTIVKRNNDPQDDESVCKHPLNYGGICIPGECPKEHCSNCASDYCKGYYQGKDISFYCEKYWDGKL